MPSDLEFNVLMCSVHSRLLRQEEKGWKMLSPLKMETDGVFILRRNNGKGEKDYLYQ